MLHKYADIHAGERAGMAKHATERLDKLQFFLCY